MTRGASEVEYLHLFFGHLFVFTARLLEGHLCEGVVVGLSSGVTLRISAEGRGQAVVGDGALSEFIAVVFLEPLVGAF